MRLSDLQKYILKSIWRVRPSQLARRELEGYYQKKKSAPSAELQIKIITRSLERLVDKGLLTAYGHKTSAKFFIEKVKLTTLGRRKVHQLLDSQLKLPLKDKRKK